MAKTLVECGPDSGHSWQHELRRAGKAVYLARRVEAIGGPTSPVTAGGEDERDPADPLNVSSVTLVATITGGTGRFAGATGIFTMRFTGVIDFATGTSAGHGSFDGHLDRNQ